MQSKGIIMCVVSTLLIICMGLFITLVQLNDIWIWMRIILLVIFSCIATLSFCYLIVGIVLLSMHQLDKYKIDKLYNKEEIIA